MKPFCSIPEAIQELKKGNMLMIIDGADRENQGDVIFPAETVTPQKVNFLLRHGHGMVCVALTSDHAVRLHLPLMVAPVDNTEPTGVQFTVSVDAADVTSFGISASDRAKTIRVLADPQAKPSDLVRPGHVFPLLAREDGILARAGHTEATVDFCRLAGFQPCGVLCEVLTKDGAIAQKSELLQFSKKYNIKLVSIADLIAYVKKNPLPQSRKKSLIKTASSLLPIRYGTFRLSVYASVIDNREYVCLRMGHGLNRTPTLVRIHSQCLTGDTFCSLKCDCGEQLHKSMQIIQQNGSGIILYLSQEGRGVGLTNKIRAYALQEQGLDTVEANQALHLPIDARDYQTAAEILRDQDITSVTLLTNNPDKVRQLQQYGITVSKYLSLEVKPNDANASYLKTKKQKLGHLLKNI